MQLTSIKLIVHGAKARAEVHGVLTAGMVGIPVTIEFDESWNGLSKNLVCRGGLGYDKFKGESRTILGVGTTAKVAPEVMIAGEVLYLGVEGYNADGSLVIPTTWACCGTIQEGVKTEGGPSEDPTLPIWEQLQARIDQFPETIHDAIEEVLKSEYAKLFIIDATNGWSSMDKTYEEIQAAYETGKILVLCHSGYALNLASAGNGFVFERYYVEGTKLVTDRCSLDEDMVFFIPRASVIEISGGSGGTVTDEHINDLINSALGVIENGTY